MHVITIQDNYQFRELHMYNYMLLSVEACPQAIYIVENNQFRVHYIVDI